MYAGYRGWFRGNDAPLRIRHLLPPALALTAAYFLVGQLFFRNLAASNSLPPAYLLGFSFLRPAVLATYLLTALAVAQKYFPRKNAVLHESAGVSYEMYLVNLIIVAALQGALAGVPSLPAAVKIPVVFVAATAASYLLGKFTIHKYPKASASVMFVLFLVMPIIFGPE
jgi:hypothetical protein